MIKLIYNVGIYALSLGLRIKGLVDSRIHEWNKTREKHCQEIDIPNDKKVIWVHCASLGEYQQAEPLLRQLKSNQSDFYLLLTFFSPSGYQYRSKIKYADKISYLPLDHMRQMRQFVDKVDPWLFIGVRYEFWWNMLSLLTKRKTNCIYINVRISSSSYLRSYYSKPFLNVLRSFDRIFTVDMDTNGWLNSLAISNVLYVGDTKVDNVVQRKKELQVVKKTISSQMPIIWGSIYLDEVELIKSGLDLFPNDQHFIVPHDVSESNVEKISRALGREAVRWSVSQNSKVVIVDVIGELFGLYKQAKWAYVGGALNGSGLHNILEASVFRIPVFIGPNYSKFVEAEILVEKGVVFPIQNSKEIHTHLEDIPTDLIHNIDDYFESHQGACTKIMEYVDLIL